MFRQFDRDEREKRIRPRSRGAAGSTCIEPSTQSARRLTSSLQRFVPATRPKSGLTRHWPTLLTWASPEPGQCQFRDNDTSVSSRERLSWGTSVARFRSHGRRANAFSGSSGVSGGLVGRLGWNCAPGDLAPGVLLAPPRIVTSDVPQAVGCSVAFNWGARWRGGDCFTETNDTRNAAVGTVKTSIET